MEKVFQFYADLINRVVLFCSGADMSIIWALPYRHRRDFILIGLCNIIMGTCSGIMIKGGLARTITAYPSEVVVFSVLFALLVILIQRALIRLVIRFDRNLYQLFYFFWAIGVLLFPVLFDAYWIFLPWVVCLLAFVVSVLLIVVNSFQLHNDLSAERKRIDDIASIEQRKKILENFRIEKTARQTRDIVSEISKADREQTTNNQIQDIFDSLNPDDLYKSAIALTELAIYQKNYPEALGYVNKAVEIEEDRIARGSDYLPNPKVYEFKAKILNLTNDLQAAQIASERFIQLSNERKYRLNLTRDITLERVEMDNLPFFGSFKWRFKPSMNILLGKNGYGKTHLLGLLIALLYDDKIKYREWIPAGSHLGQARVLIRGDVDLELELIRGKTPEQVEQIRFVQRSILANNEGLASPCGRIPLLAIPDSRFINRSEDSIAKSKTVSTDLKKDGATEFLYDRLFSVIIKNGLSITAQQNSKDFSKEPYRMIERVISELAGTDFFKFERIELVPTTGDYKFYVRSEDSHEQFLLQKISQGTFSILSICLMIYRFLCELRPESMNPRQEKAIVLIDEIDAHLHPSWEQKIIGVLRREFPNVQFIVTAHSPLIVAGCYEGEVSVIRREKDGFVLEQCKENFIGRTSPQLLERIFEVEDKDSNYVRYSSLAARTGEYEVELESLKDKEGRSTEDLNRMDELSRDLNYINSALKVQSKNVDASVLKTENRMLESEIRTLREQLEELKKEYKPE
jgi:predicted ATP-binding protein involved in virulence